MIGNEKRKSNGSLARRKTMWMSVGGINSGFLQVVYLDRDTMAMATDTQMELQDCYIQQPNHASDTREHRDFTSNGRI
jgi:hypothetical protein